ncbi:FecR domain-containing protein [Candidatus Falkowbacteria bacterium]|nr:FecR domain-containing protein [Candidatus Falkowbacteria bacterium]
MKFYSNHPYAGNYYKKSFFKTRGFIFLLIFIILAAGFVCFSIRTNKNETQTEQKFTDQTEMPINSAKIVFTAGKVELKTPNEDWQEVAENYQAQSGDYVKTNLDAKAIIEFPDKSVLRLAGNAEIKISAMGMADIIVEQISGPAFHRVNSESTAIYRVKNGETEITALGTGFNVLASGPLTYLTVTEGKTKVKIFSGEDIINIRTVEEGMEATINPTLTPEESIKTENIKMEELLKNDWYSWNLDRDREKNYYLGIFEKTIKLIISEPKEVETTTDSEKITIKGATDPAAEIFMAGKEIENNQGQFQTELALSVGKNEIEITVKKEKNVNKKTIIVNTSKQKENIVLTGNIVGKNSIVLSWEMKNINDFQEFKVLQSGVKNPTYPNAPYHTIAKTTASDKWSELPPGNYFFRVCAFNLGKCDVYSNDFAINLSDKDYSAEPIVLSAAVDKANVSLNWIMNPSLNATEGFKSVIGTAKDPVFPGNSYHSLSGNQRNDIWKKLNAGTYYFRVCLLKNGSCGAYSGNASATISASSEEGSITLTGSAGDGQINLYWTTEGLKITKGFKVIMDESADVSFPGKAHHLNTSSSASSDVWTNLQTGETYYFRVCQNLGSECGTYSNEIEVGFK